jgi:hypothetical protein
LNRLQKHQATGMSVEREFELLAADKKPAFRTRLQKYQSATNSAEQVLSK